MKKIRWQLVIIFITGLVVGVLLITQQGGGIAQTTSSPTTGGVYTEGLVGSFGRLNPLLDSYNQVDRDVDKLLFSGLVKFDSTGYPQPDLAEGWTISSDNLVYNFSLRKGLVWHDGEPLTTEDVIFTIDLIRNGEAYASQDLRDLWNEVEVEATSDTLITFTLPEAYSPFLDYLTFGTLPKHLLESVGADGLVDADFNLSPIGSGPYKFDQMIVEDNQIVGVVLSVFDKFYGEKPFIEQIVFRFYPDTTAALTAYGEGEIMGIGQVTKENLPAVLPDTNLAVYTARLPELSLVLFNLNNSEVAFLQEKEIRQALMMGLNRQWIIDHIMEGQAIQADGPLFPGTWAYSDNLVDIEYDPQGAIDLLKEAEYVIPSEGDAVRAKEEVRLEFDLDYPDEYPFADIAERMKEDWAVLGVQVNLNALTYDQLVNEVLADRSYEAALVSLNLTGSPDPDPYPFWDLSEATGGQNYTQWNNKNVSEYIEQARITTNFEKRLLYYHNFQAIFMDELPALPLFYPVYNYAVDTQVQGVQVGPLFDPSDRFGNITQWYLVAKRGTESTVEATTAATP